MSSDYDKRGENVDKCKSPARCQTSILSLQYPEVKVNCNYPIIQQWRAVSKKAEKNQSL